MYETTSVSLFILIFKEFFTKQFATLLRFCVYVKVIHFIIYRLRPIAPNVIPSLHPI